MDIDFAKACSNRSSAIANQCLACCSCGQMLGTVAQAEAADGDQSAGERQAYLDSVLS
jgi:hypothetical protein